MRWQSIATTWLQALLATSMNRETRLEYQPHLLHLPR